MKLVTLIGLMLTFTTSAFAFRACVYANKSIHAKWYYSVNDPRGDLHGKSRARLNDETWVCMDLFGPVFRIHIETDDTSVPWASWTSVCRFDNVTEEGKFYVSSTYNISGPQDCRSEGGGPQLRINDKYVVKSTKPFMVKGEVELGGPISGSVLKIRLANGKALKNAITGNGKFEVQMTEAVPAGSVIEATGGSIDGKELNGTLSALVEKDTDFSKEVIQINPVTSVLARYARGRDTVTYEQKVAKVLAYFGIKKDGDVNGDFNLDDYIGVKAFLVEAEKNGLDVVLDSMVDDLIQGKKAKQRFPIK